MRHSVCGMQSLAQHACGECQLAQHINRSGNYDCWGVTYIHKTALEWSFGRRRRECCQVSLEAAHLMYTVGPGTGSQFMQHADS